MQGIILVIAAILGIIIGAGIGWWLRQSRIDHLAEALQASHDHGKTLEREHERRLREATEQLLKDYEIQLAEKIERYQDHLEERIEAIEREYQGRFAVAAQGQRQAILDDGNRVPLQAQSPAVHSLEAQIKQEYEQRLQTTSQKVQHAYEQQLQQELRDRKAELQHHYEARLAEKIEHYEHQLASQKLQLEQEFDLRLQALTAGQEAATDFEAKQRATIEAECQAAYEQKLAEKIEHYQDDLSRRLDDLKAEYEGRLQAAQPAISAEEMEAAIAARLQTDYEQKLAEKIEYYQDDLSRRLADMQQEFEARLQLIQAQPSEPVSPAADTTPGDTDETTIQATPPVSPLFVNSVSAQSEEPLVDEVIANDDVNAPDWDPNYATAVSDQPEDALPMATDSPPDLDQTDVEDSLDLDFLAGEETANEISMPNGTAADESVAPTVSDQDQDIQDQEAGIDLTASDLNSPDFELWGEETSSMEPETPEAFSPSNEGLDFGESDNPGFDLSDQETSSLPPDNLGNLDLAGDEAEVSESPDFDLGGADVNPAPVDGLTALDPDNQGLDFGDSDTDSAELNLGDAAPSPEAGGDFTALDGNDSDGDQDFLSELNLDSDGPDLDFNDDDSEDFSPPVEDLGGFSNDVADADVEAVLAGLSDEASNLAPTEPTTESESRNLDQLDSLEELSFDDGFSTQEQDPDLGGELDLGDSSGGDEFNLDDLLFEQADGDQDSDDPFNLNDIENLS
ncbi:hypothetical protein C7271_05710 [filamentous cyanobacterium CCP5]|nr:hypothetical protein C7271_05710 [filamentous cyanobacterium CCP5]